jgi:FkbM family methyltransferase
MRSYLRKALRAADIEVRRAPRALIRSPHSIHLNLDFALAHLACRPPGADRLVVQVGAFDGQTNDPIHDSLVRFGWRGILLEPQPVPFASLRALHEGNQKVRTINVAVGACDGTRDLFVVDPDPDLPDFSQQVASFDPDHPRNALRADVVTRRVPTPTLTFDTILGQESVDVLHLDAEGYDAELLRLFDVPRRLPTVIGYEHKHLSRREQNEAAEMLIACDYHLAVDAGSGDTVAYRLG